MYEYPKSPSVQWVIIVIYYALYLLCLTYTSSSPNFSYYLKNLPISNFPFSSTRLNTHKGLYEALRDSVKQGTSGDQHLAEMFLFDFEQSGIQLEEGPRRRVVALNDLILQTGQRFMAGAAKPRKVLKSAVPQNVRHL